MRKKLLSILLSAALAITVIPASGVVVFADAADGYGLYVGGVEVTADNAQNIPCDSGSAVYSPEKQQLTLTDATISYDKPEAEGVGAPDVQGAIGSTKDITIVLEGKNEISCNNTNGICVIGGNLTFKSADKAASLQIADSIFVTGKIDNSANVTVTTLDDEGAVCEQFVNSGDFCVEPMEGYEVYNGIVAEDSFTNTGNVVVKDIAEAIFTQDFNQKSGTITVGDKFGTAISCLKYNQTGGTVDLTCKNINASSIMGVALVQDEKNSTFNMAGGKLNVTIDAKDGNEKMGIAAMCPSFKISGGETNINVGKGMYSVGIEILGPAPEISGGTVNIAVNGLPSKYENDFAYCTFVYAEDMTAAKPSGITADGLMITASNNLDGSDPEAYDSGKVLDGYKYMRIEKIVGLKSLSLSKTSYYCTGKSQGPALTVKDVNGKTVSSANYTVSGTKKAAKPGTYKVTVKGKNACTGSLSKSYTIKVKPTKIVSLAKGTKSFTVKTSKLTSTYSTGYQVRYSLKKSMSSAKTVTISSKSSSVKKTVKNLKKGKTYYVQVRTIKKVDGKKYYSAWSDKKSVKTK